VVKLQRVLQLLVVGFLLGVSVQPQEVGHAQPAVSSVAPALAVRLDTSQVAAQDLPDEFVWVGENETFELYANPSTLAFQVLDKRSGYLWHSNLDQKEKSDRLNKTWTAFAQSGISIDYVDQKTTSERASIANSEHTMDFQLTADGFEATVTFTIPSIQIQVRVQLEPQGVRVEVPFEAIREEDPAFKLGLLYVYPFLGATRLDSVPGYMFIPDGSGSVIAFAAETKAQNMFYGRYYGADLGMIATLPYDPTIIRPYKISVPVFGMAHGEKQHAFLSVIEKGASYAEIQAHPAGIITNFNFLYNAFVYNESYFQATNRSGAGVTTLQPKTNVFDIVMHYRFLTGEQSDYVGMARSYQEYLLEKGALRKVTMPQEHIGVRLEFLGAEKEKILFWQRAVPMTTIEQMGEILARLNVANPEVVYYGWQPLGASSMPPKSFKLERTLGTKGQLAELNEKIGAQGGNFYLYLDPQAAIRDEPGYSSRYDLAMSITNFNLTGFNRNKVNYFLNADAIETRYTRLSQDVLKDLSAGLALDGIGSTLYSDFQRDHVLNREETIQQYQYLVAGQGGEIAAYVPNDYMFGLLQAYFDMPLTDSGYIYTTAAVPFLQIVFAGYVPYYGSALNFSSNLQEDLLKHADFGVYPSFFLSHEVTAKILFTRSNWIYTSSDRQWAGEVEAAYQWLDGVLGPVQGQRIIARQALAAGVFATTYDNGKQVIVNYTGQDFADGGLLVQAKDAVVVDVEVRP